MTEKIKKANEPYSPKPEATKYRFMCGRTKFVVNREGNLFYHEHPDGVTEELIGDYKKLAHSLHSQDASWITRDEGRHRPKTEKVFFDRTVAMSLLRQGCSVYCASMHTIVRFSEDYSQLICLDGKGIADLPSSRFMRAFLEPCNDKSYEAMIAEKKEAEAKQAERDAEAERLEAEKLEAERIARMNEEARKKAERNAETARLEAERLEAENVRLKEAERKTPTPVEQPKRGFKWWLERVGLFLGGVAVGVAAYDKLTTKKSC